MWGEVALDAASPGASEHFCCIAGPLQAEAYELQVSGDLEEMSFKLEDIKKLPKHTVKATIQCSGNRRTEMSASRREGLPPVRGLPWTSGAMSTAEWSGAKLRDVLLAAGLTEDMPNVRVCWRSCCPCCFTATLPPSCRFLWLPHPLLAPGNPCLAAGQPWPGSSLLPSRPRHRHPVDPSPSACRPSTWHSYLARDGMAGRMLWSSIGGFTLPCLLHLELFSAAAGGEQKLAKLPPERRGMAGTEAHHVCWPGHGRDGRAVRGRPARPKGCREDSGRKLGIPEGKGIRDMCVCFGGGGQ